MPRPPLPRPHRDDVLIALAGLLGGVLLWRLGLSTATPWEAPGPPGALSLVPLAAMCVAALLRRVAQPWALGLAVVALAGDLAVGSLLATVLMFTDVVYAAVLYGPPRTARLVPAGMVLVSVAVMAVAFVAWDNVAGPLAVGVVAALVTAAPAYTGLIVRDHRDTAEAERLRAQQTALLAEMDRTQAVAAERARMARELHDIVANHLSAIALHSTAALSLPDGEREATRRALGVIRENSVDGLAEMRRLIGLLRQDEKDDRSGAVPSLEGVAALVERARAAAPEGLDLTLEDAHTTVPPTPVDLAAYRVVQEAVTNALKHAAPGEVRVVLREEGGALQVDVRNRARREDGPDAPRAPGTGTGLIGMRERVDLLGGTLDAGPDGPHHWRVLAELPLRERESA